MKGLNSIDFNKFDKDHKFRIGAMRFFSFLPDSAYLKFVYRMRTGKKLNLKKPATYNEKLNWLKLHNIHEEYTDLVDKLKVKEYVGNIIGKEYIIPTIGHWESFDEIDWDTLPTSFVLKCNHDSGSIKFIRDKNILTAKERETLKKHFDKRVMDNPFFAGREYPYKNVKSCIIAEPLIEVEPNKMISDYKFFCFDGDPKMLMIVSGRGTDPREDFFDMDYNPLHIINCHIESDIMPARPKCFDEMKNICTKLSKGIPHVRIDLYEINGQIKFGEYTFFTNGGYVLFKPDEWEQQMGDWIKI